MRFRQAIMPVIHFCVIFFGLIFTYSCYKPITPDLRSWTSSLAKAKILKVNNPGNAISFIDSVFYTIPNPTASLRIDRYMFISGCHKKTKVYSKVVAYCDSAIGVFGNDHEHLFMLAATYLDRGDALMQMKEYPDAYQCYFNGLLKSQHFKSSKGDTVRLELYSRLADISFGQGKYKEAITWYRKASEEITGPVKNNVNYKRLGGLENNIGLCYAFLKMPAQALVYYERALLSTLNELKSGLLSPKEFEVTTAVIKGNMGSAYKNSGNVRKAEALFLQSVNVNDKQGYAPEDALITKIKLLNLYLDELKFKNATNYFQQINSSAQFLSNPNDQSASLRTKIRYYNALSKFKMAMMLYPRYEHLKDSLQESKRVYLAANLDSELSKFNSQNSLKKIEKDDRVKTIIMATVCALLIISVYLIIVVLRTRQKIEISKNQLLQKNIYLTTTLESLELSFADNNKLLGVVAHDLKNPLNAINGLSQILAGSANIDDEESETISLIIRSTTTMAEIINDLLSAKSKQADDNGRNADHHIKDIIAESIALLKNRAQQKNISIVLTKDEDCIVTIRRQQIWRVINNLLVNAIKFSKQNSSIYVATNVGDGSVMVSIKDNGIGIPDELKDKIFDLSGKAKREGTAGEETHGMGLYISKQIIEEYGGHLWFDSLEGTGTEFYVTIPCKQNC